MMKQDLVAHIRDHAGLGKVDSKKALDAMLDGISSELAAGGEVKLPGFGNFSIRHSAARTIKGPMFDKPVHVAAKKHPVFKAGKSLKDLVNN